MVTKMQPMRIRVDVSGFELSGSPEAINEFLAGASAALSDKEMADFAGVSERTIRRWRQDPRFPESIAGGSTRLSFLRYLWCLETQPGKKRTN